MRTEICRLNSKLRCSRSSICLTISRFLKVQKPSICFFESSLQWNYPFVSNCYLKRPRNEKTFLFRIRPYGYMILYESSAFALVYNKGLGHFKQLLDEVFVIFFLRFL